MNTAPKKAISALLCLALAASSFGMTEQASAKVYKKTDAETRIPTYNDSIDYKLYMEQYADVASATKEIVLKGSNYTTTDMDVTVEGDNVVLGKEGSITWKFNIPSDALYEIEVEYCALDNDGNDIQMALRINDEIPFAQASSFTFRRMYTDESKDYQFVAGNQAAPSQVEVIGWQKVSLEDIEATKLIKEKYPNADTVTVYDGSFVTYQPSGLYRSKAVMCVKILTEAAGVKFDLPENA